MPLPEPQFALTELPTGKVATILQIRDDLTACKLMCLGLMPGCEIELVRAMPFKGSLYVRLRHHQVALRFSEAAAIIVQEQQQF